MREVLGLDLRIVVDDRNPADLDGLPIKSCAEGDASLAGWEIKLRLKWDEDFLPLWAAADLELDGFVEGLFGAEEHINLPERAHRALGVLADIRAMLAGAVDLLDDSSKTAEPDDLKGLTRNFQELSVIVETEMNKAILSCVRARRQPLEQIPASKPTLH